jgi:hypothetical protein
MLNIIAQNTNVNLLTVSQANDAAAELKALVVLLYLGCIKTTNRIWVILVCGWQWSRVIKNHLVKTNIRSMRFNNIKIKLKERN